MYSQRFWKWLQIPLATLRPWRPPSSPSRRLVTRLLHPPRQQCPVLQNFSTKLQLTASISASSVMPLTKVWAPWRHTSYLSFHLHRQDFRKPNFTPKKRLKTPKTLKMSLKKSNVCSFFLKLNLEKITPDRKFLKKIINYILAPQYDFGM